MIVVTLSILINDADSGSGRGCDPDHAARPGTPCGASAPSQSPRCGPPVRRQYSSKNRCASIKSSSDANPRSLVHLRSGGSSGSTGTAHG